MSCKGARTYPSGIHVNHQNRMYPDYGDSYELQPAGINGPCGIHMNAYESHLPKATVLVIHMNSYESHLPQASVLTIHMDSYESHLP